MARKKKSESGLTYQEILTSYILTLSENKCQEAYQLLRERFDVSRPRMVRLNKDGVVDTSGLVRLRPGELDKLMKTCGEYKFIWLINKLHTYLEELKERGEAEPDARRRFKQYQKISHYYKLTKGWVAIRYNAEGIQAPATSKTTRDFYSICSMEEAQEYIDSLPPELRVDNPEIDWLVSVYPLLAIRKEDDYDDIG